MKVGRDYSLTVGIGPYGAPERNGESVYIAYAQGSATIKPPFTLEFDIRREFMASSQTASVRIKNLSRQTRDSIYKDPFATGNYATFELRAGYGGQFLPVVFNGTIIEAQSRREGRKDIVTEISAFDGGLAIGNSYSSTTFAPNTPLVDAFKKLNGDLIGVSNSPIIGTVPGTVGTRPYAAVGPTFNIIQSLLPQNVSATIDLNQLKILSDTDAVSVGQTVFNISSDTGLLDPPVRSEYGVYCRILFEPRITLGQQVQLISKDNPKFNGSYQVKSVSHQGIISPTENGPAFTTIGLYNFGIITKLTGGIFNPQNAAAI